MLKDQLAHFRALRPSVKAMVYLAWLYSFVSALTSIFVQIFLYQQFGSVTFNIVGMMLYFLGCAVGFSLVGAVASWLRLNIKWGYLAGFFALSASFLWLYGDTTRADALLFMLTNGFGLGVYWVTLHTFELTETLNAERDYYSSVLSAGDQVVDLIAPALATLLIVLSERVFHFGAYTLLFIIAPLCYLSGLPFLRHIRDYRPSPIDAGDVRHFLYDRKNRHAQVYLFAGSATFAFSRVVLPIAAIVFLGSETNVGIVTTVFAVISAVVLMYLAKRRHSGNRLNFLFVTSSLLAGFMFYFAFRFDLAAFMLFSLAAVIVKPLQRVSAHVIDLETMETLGRKGRDFFATMIFRDAALGVWRITALGLFAAVVATVGEGAPALRLGLVLLAAATLLTYFGAALLYRKY